MNMEKSKDIELFVIQSKKSGKFLKFIELYDDGYGVYEDSVSFHDIQNGEMPDTFAPYTYIWNNQSQKSEKVYLGDVINIKTMLICDVPKHENADLEMVKVTMTFG